MKVEDEVDDDAQSLGGRSSKASAAWGAVMKLPISWDGVKEKCCNSCGESCFSQCPFGDPHGLYDGCRPWQRYALCPSCPGHRMIIGKHCLICAIVFNLLGYKLAYGTIAKYLASPLLRSNPEEHRSFIKAVKEYIKQQNENPNLEKTVLSKALHDAKCVVVEESRKGSRKIQRRTFVQKNTYQELYAHTDDFKDKQLELDNLWIDDKLGTQVRLANYISLRQCAFHINF